MQELERTEWYTIGTDGNPMRHGYYEVCYEYDNGAPRPTGARFLMRYWDGGDWYLDEQDYLECHGGKRRTCCFGWDNDRWRGLVENPHGDITF